MSDINKIIITGIACLAVGVAAGNFITTNNSDSTTSNIDSDKVKGIVANYIAENPEKIIASLQSLQQKAANEQQAKIENAVKNNIDALTDASNSPSVGSGESGITLVEFFDYQCGYCKRMAETVQKLLKSHPDVKVIFKEFPILSANSQKAAQASLAISYLAPARYLEFHMMLMKHKGEFTQTALNDYAGQVKVDADKFQAEMNGQRVAKEIQRVAALADNMGIQGTPALVIGDKLIPGAIPFAELDRHVKTLKAEKATKK